MRGWLSPVCSENGGESIMHRSFYKIFCFCLFLFALQALLPRASHSDWIPFVSTTVGGEYDSNIYLDPERKDPDGDSAADFRTTITPTIGIRNEQEHFSFSGEYAPTVNLFMEHSDQDYISHNLGVSMEKALTQHLNFFIDESALYTEEPEQRYGDRERREHADPNARLRERTSHWDNTISTGFRYQFGPEDTVSLRYNDSRINYSSGNGEENDDSVEYGPEIELSYWFNQQHGITAHYSWRRYDYEIDNSRKTQEGGFRYHYRYSPHLTLFLNYSLEFAQEYGEKGRDYYINRCTAGFDKQFSPSWRLSMNGGFWNRSDTDSDIQELTWGGWDSSDSGFTGSLTLEYTYDRLHWTVTGEAGTMTAFNDYENRGFTEFRSISTSISYQLRERINAFASASYYHDLTPGGTEDGDDLRTETYRFSAGASYLILPWLTSAIEYQYNESSETETDDYPAGYQQHVIMLNFTARHEWL